MTPSYKAVFVAPVCMPGSARTGARAQIYFRIAASAGRLAQTTNVSKRAKKTPRASVPAPVVVSVVDDDESLRESLPVLLGELGFVAQAFASADAFLRSGAASQTHCLILDIAMPDMTGPQLQRELAVRGHAIPIIFITAQADESVRAQLIAQGAIDCLFKPFSAQTLKATLNAALQGRPER
jgi:CheY-like chemotaxis protein